MMQQDHQPKRRFTQYPDEVTLLRDIAKWWWDLDANGKTLECIIVNADEKFGFNANVVWSYLQN